MLVCGLVWLLGWGSFGCTDKLCGCLQITKPHFLVETLSITEDLDLM